MKQKKLIKELNLSEKDFEEIKNKIAEIPAPINPYGICDNPCSKLSQPHAEELIIVASE